MKAYQYWNKLWNRVVNRSVVFHSENKLYMECSKILHWVKCGCSILFCFFVILFFVGCSGNQEKNQAIPTVTEEPKSLLEQAVDWGNENLFASQMSYASFILEEKRMNQTNYPFLLMNEKDQWESELYYIVSEDDQVQKLVFCGGGNKELFSYEIVLLSNNCYVAVDSATQMGDGRLELYPFDHPEDASYFIDKVIDNHYEGIVLKDVNGNKYGKSEVFEGGKLLPDYQDKDGDGYTDISFTGTKLIYEDKIGDISDFALAETMTCSRTYYYIEEIDSFILGDESEEIIKTEREKLYDYTGYLDMNSYFAKDNPVKDYDGDGLEDRIYKEYYEDTGKNILTLEFGNGKKLQLSDISLGIFFKTESADLTGDGQNEILFEQYGIGTGGTYMYLSIFSEEDESYVRMENPYEEIDTNAPNSGGMFCVPLKIEKLNDTTLTLYQPDCGYQGRFTPKKILNNDGSIFNDLEHLYYPDMEDKYLSYSANSLKLVKADKNRMVLLFQSKLGDKWVCYYIYWKLEYIDGEWEITNVYQPTPIRVGLGEEYHTDLNGDNQNEVICYDTKLEKKDGYNREIPVLTLNGIEYDGAYFEKEYGILMTNCSHIGYYLMDIDISDTYTEIAIVEEGLNSDPVTYLFQYDGEKIEYCGAITDSPENGSFLVDGDGTISAQKRLSILQSWSAIIELKYDQNGILQEQTQDFYYTYRSPEDKDQNIIAKKNLILFQNPEINQDSIMIRKGQKLYLTATDNKNWIQISDYEGHQGWFYLHNRSGVILPGGEGKIEDILTNLNIG